MSTGSSVDFWCACRLRADQLVSSSVSVLAVERTDFYPNATVTQTWSKRRCANGDDDVPNGVFVSGLWKKVWASHEATESRWCTGAPTHPGVAVYQEKLEVSDSTLLYIYIFLNK